MPRAITLKDSASSPSWSRLLHADAVRRSRPCRSRSVPCDSACTLRVIERASSTPRTSATQYITAKTTPTAAQIFMSRAPVTAVPDDSRCTSPTGW